MAFKLERENVDKSEVILQNKVYQSADAALKDAMSIVSSYIQAHWSSVGQGTVDGPPMDDRFKIYIDRQPFLPQPFVLLKYDYPVPPPDNQTTNNIYWRVVEI